MNILKFRRKTHGPYARSEPVQIESSRQQFQPGSDISDTLPTDLICNGKRKKQSSLCDFTQTFTTLLDLRQLNPEPVPCNLENTYKVQPDAGEKFNPDAVRAIVYRTLNFWLSGIDYEHITGGRMALSLTEDIKDKIKRLQKPRYKVICQTVITQAVGQGLEAASKCVWDNSTDNYTCVIYRTKDLVAIATVYGVYLE